MFFKIYHFSTTIYLEINASENPRFNRFKFIGIFPEKKYSYSRYNPELLERFQTIDGSNILPS